MVTVNDFFPLYFFALTGSANATLNVHKSQRQYYAKKSQFDVFRFINEKEIDDEIKLKKIIENCDKDSNNE